MKFNYEAQQKRVVDASSEIWLRVIDNAANGIPATEASVRRDIVDAVIDCIKLLDADHAMILGAPVAQGLECTFVIELYLPNCQRMEE